MRFSAVAILSGLSLAAALPTGAVADTAPNTQATHRSVSGLSFVAEVQLSPRLREFTLQTPALITRSLGPMPGNLTGQTKVRVLLPEGYDPQGTRRYPVLYLYRGGGGTHETWTTPATAGDAEGLTNGLPLIVVMPEAGMAGGYADWYNGGRFGPPQWKTYHLDQLIPWIDANFRTVTDRTGRATAGLSMGGGGLRYAAMRPDLIGITAAFSGDIDILQPASDWNGMGAPISTMIWGDRTTEEVRWRAANGPDLAKNLGNSDVAIFTGDTGKPEGVYILQGSTAAHDRLDALGITHQFTIQPGMTHSWPTWNEALRLWLPHLMTRFRVPQRDDAALETEPKSSRPVPMARPAAFSYSSIEPTYSLYGWDVSLKRAAVEFSALEAVTPRHFTVFGSGDAEVTTPVMAAPNSTVRAVLVNRDQPQLTSTFVLKTDAQGRLVVPIRLGPANQFQQYSAEAKAAATSTAPDKVPFIAIGNGSRFYRVDVQLTVE